MMNPYIKSLIISAILMAGISAASADQHKTQLSEKLKANAWQIGTWTSTDYPPEGSQATISYSPSLDGHAIEIEGEVIRDGEVLGKIKGLRYYDDDKRAVVTLILTGDNAKTSIGNLYDGKLVRRATHVNDEGGVVTWVNVVEQIDADTYRRTINPTDPDGATKNWEFIHKRVK